MPVPLATAQVTVVPEVPTLLPLASASWAVMVTAAPAAGVVVLAVTMYCVAAAAVPTISAVAPVNGVVLLSVAVTTWDDAVAFVVNVIVAMPAPSVVDVLVAAQGPDPKQPPPVLVQVTTLPDVVTALLFASVSCAETVTCEPALGV